MIMFGLSYESLNTIGLWAMIGGITFGGLALVLTAISSVALYSAGNISQREAATFQRQSAERIAVINRETAQAQLEREQLKAELAWREWSPELVSTLQDHLAAHPASVTIQYVANDPETASFAIQINNAFYAARWDTRMLSASYTGMLITGLFVIGSDETAVENTRAAFRATGINHSTDTPPREPYMKSGDGRPSDVMIIVGSKPRPR